MEDTSSTAQNIMSKCPVCRTIIDAEDVFCNNCGYPRKGTEHEQRMFLLKRNTQKSKLERANKKLWQATNTLFIIGAIIGVLALGNCFLGYTALRGNFGQMISQVTLAVTFVALGFWCKKRPLPAILCGFSLYLLLQIMYAILSPNTIINGIVPKLFFIGFLINGIISALEAEKLKKEMNVK
jgi:hypothetical protein